MSATTIQAIFISYDGMTDPLGQSQVIPYLAGLSKHNIHFTLISFEKPDAFAISGNSVSEQLNMLGIRWIPLSYTKKPPVLSAAYNTWKLKQAVKHLLKYEKIDIIHCRSYIPALVGIWAKKQYGTRFLFDMRGFWADERVDGKLWNLRNPVYRIVYNYFKKKELEFLQLADHTVSLTEAAKSEILSWPALKGKDIPISVIPCCVDMELFDPQSIDPSDQNNWRSRLGIAEGDLIISYVGSIGTWYMLDEMLGFFKKLHEVKPNARFLFITRSEHERILERAEKFGVADAVIIQSASRYEVPVLLSLSDLSVFFILPAYSKIASSPTKQGEIMAMGIPVVCNPGVGDTEEIVRRYHSGYLADPDNPEAAVQAIAAGKDDFSSPSIRAGAKAYFSLELGVSAFLKIYRNLIPGGTVM